MRLEGSARLALVLVVFVGIGIAFTLLSLSASPESSRVGTLRPAATIPLHEAELLGMGLAVGLLACAAARRLDASFIVLPMVFISLIDLDHLPAALSAAQPIRPAHSVLFIVSVVACLWAIGQPLEIEMLATAAFLGHLGVDTGVFPLLSPFSFAYYRLTPFAPYLLAASLLVGVGAGLASRRKKRTTPMPGPVLAG